MNPTSFQLTFGGDMSEDRESNVFSFGQHRHACLQISNPATDTPVGVYALLVGNDQSNLAAYGVSISPQPAGSAYNHVFDNVETNALFGQVAYTATSGGEGAFSTVTVTLRE